MKTLYNLKDVAEKLGLSRQTVYNQLKNNTFPLPPVPGLTPRRWRASDVDKFVAGEDK
jgi:excisionase family DNA binding protein